jgi:hypothetical protein
MSKDIYIYYKTGPVIAHNRTTFDTPNGTSLSAIGKIKYKAIKNIGGKYYGYF